MTPCEFELKGPSPQGYWDLIDFLRTLATNGVIHRPFKEPGWWARRGPKVSIKFDDGKDAVMAKFKWSSVKP